MVGNLVLSSHAELWIPGAPVLLFRGLTDRQIETITKEITLKRKKEKKEKPDFCCIYCRNIIAKCDAVVPVAGQHRHSFINPAGIHYEIGCFSSAPGCFNTGDPTMQFTWFPGYTWCYAVCGKCYAHLGWYYQSGESHFHGLILNRLTRTSS